VTLSRYQELARKVPVRTPTRSSEKMRNPCGPCPHCVPESCVSKAFFKILYKEWHTYASVQQAFSSSPHPLCKAIRICSMIHNDMRCQGEAAAWAASKRATRTQQTGGLVDATNPKSDNVVSPAGSVPQGLKPLDANNRTACAASVATLTQEPRILESMCDPIVVVFHIGEKMMRNGSIPPPSRFQRRDRK
jgi:hypothetical protein